MSGTATLCCTWGVWRGGGCLSVKLVSASLHLCTWLLHIKCNFSTLALTLKRITPALTLNIFGHLLEGGGGCQCPFRIFWLGGLNFIMVRPAPPSPAILDRENSKINASASVEMVVDLRSDKVG